MSSKVSRNDNELEKKMPDVFERLSRQQNNRVNSRQRNIKSAKNESQKLPHESIKSPKSNVSSVNRKNVAANRKFRQVSKNKDQSYRAPIRELKERKTGSVSDTYDEKVQMEKVPETVGKDLDESTDESSRKSSECDGSWTDLSEKSSGIWNCESDEIRDENSSVIVTDNKVQELDSKPNLNLSSEIRTDKSIQNQNQKINVCNNRNYVNSCNNLNSDVISANLNNKTDVSTAVIDGRVSRRNGSNIKVDCNILSQRTDDSVSRNFYSRSSPNSIKKESYYRLQYSHEGHLSDSDSDQLTVLKPDKFNGHERTQKKTRSKVVIDDDDKDICETESDDSEFYNVRVQTRLVSYENSTLFIRNTSKQSLECPNDGENTSLRESSSSSSLQSSLNGQEAVSDCKESPSEPPLPEERELIRLTGVKSKLGQLMNRGKCFLTDVCNSPYVPDVFTTFNKFQGVTRRSLKAAMPSPKGLIFDSPRISKKEPEMEHNKAEYDSGFSSLISVERSGTSPLPPLSTDKIIPGDRVTYNEEDLKSPQNEESDRSTMKENLEVEIREYKKDSHVTPEEHTDAERTNFGRFFSSCPCETEAFPSSSERVCSCSRESEFPMEIQELLDSDHARMWWTITGNFGNILPIDWSKTYTRQKYLPVLNLNETKKLEGSVDSVTPSPREDDDEEVAHDLDLHQLILAGSQQDAEPVKSAEEVIKEIDDIMQEGSSSEDEGIDATSSDSRDSYRSELQHLPPPLYHDKLKDLNVNELNETLMDLEMVVRRYSETLIAQLAHRDELEYEKELKNTFISLLLQVQNKRRNYNVEKKKLKKSLGPNGIDPKYLTTVIPYDVGHGPPDNETIQILIKILTAINEDSPTVPTLLTDYILKVLCPS